MSVSLVKSRMIATYLITSTLLAGWGIRGLAKSEPPVASPMLATLATKPMIDILERENLINQNQLCPASLGKEGVKVCRDKQLSPEKWIMELHEDPSSRSKQVGQLIFIIKPGAGITATFKPVSGKEIAFVPDVYDPDWGYGPYYDQTILRRKETWVQLPQRPFPKPVWLDLAAPRGKGLALARQEVDHVIKTPLETGSIYRLKQSVTASTEGQKNKQTLPTDSSLFILEIKDQMVRFREETPGDYACGGEEVPPQKTKPREYTAELKSFFDSDSHVIAVTKYTRGC